ncbi:hypothetical protein BC830DRAFT_1111659 [Chytriomyces sp. MP71]|nr:hypothetical protein BC830DRAFT_1111659 [Chytriomyces sp. MP71]
MLHFLSSSIAPRPVEGKGNGFVCVDPEGIHEDVMLLKETPLESWGSNYDPPATAVRLLIRSESDLETRARLSHLFPTTDDMASHHLLANCTEEAITRVRQLLASYGSSICPTTPEVQRVLLCIQCNSFPTGLLATLSYVNHSCAPSCRVFQEESATGTIYSLWTTRAIAPGEECTISYLDIATQVIMARERRERLLEKFLFECACELCHAPVPSIGFCGPNTVGPCGEDIRCRTCWIGRVRFQTGFCEGCGHQATCEEMQANQEKHNILVVKIQRHLAETKRMVETCDMQSKKKQVIELPVVQSLRNYTETLESILRLECEPFFFGDHIALIPLRHWIDTLRSRIRREDWAARMRLNKKRS